MTYACSPCRNFSAVVLGGLVVCLASQSSSEANPPAQHTKSSAACGFAEVSIEGDVEEAALACGSLARVVSYFAEAGFELVPRVTISFVEEIGDMPWPHPPHGYFDLKRAKIVIARRAVDRWWGLAEADELLGSLHHEMSHMAVAAILREDFDRLPRSWHEFIAYWVQLDLLEKEVRQEVLSRYADMAGFSAVNEVNDFLVEFLPPERLALMSYKAYRRWGGQEFLGRLLRFEVEVNCMGDLTNPSNQPSCRN